MSRSARPLWRPQRAYITSSDSHALSEPRDMKEQRTSPTRNHSISPAKTPTIQGRCPPRLPSREQFRRLRPARDQLGLLPGQDPKPDVIAPILSREIGSVEHDPRLAPLLPPVLCLLVSSTASQPWQIALTSARAARNCSAGFTYHRLSRPSAVRSYHPRCPPPCVTARTRYGLRATWTMN